MLIFLAGDKDTRTAASGEERHADNNDTSERGETLPSPPIPSSHVPPPPPHPSLSQYLSQFDLSPVFQSVEEMEYWLTPHSGIITCYVVEVRGIFLVTSSSWQPWGTPNSQHVVMGFSKAEPNRDVGISIVYYIIITSLFFCRARRVVR